MEITAAKELWYDVHAYCLLGAYGNIPAFLHGL